MMKIFSIFILVMFLTISINAQELENYLASRLGLVEYTGDIKCATKYELQLRLQEDKLERNLQNMYKMFKTEPVRAESLTTTHFTLHWDEIGPHAVPVEDILGNGIPDYIDSAAVFLEYAWDVEINQMNYSPPPQQNGQPVTNYHIYFTSMPYYGLTTGSGNDIQSLPGENWTSYIELENDYQENYFATKGLDGLRVTVAHEFHHAIEFGYNIRQADYFYYEMTATWMEDVLYTEINDYYNYLSSLFNNVGLRRFDNFSGFYPYGNSLYNFMISKQYGDEIVKEVWDEIRNRPVIDALEATLAAPKFNSSWIKSLSDYGLWLYFTGNRSKTEYFPESVFYPQVNIQGTNTYQFADSLVFENSLLSNSFKYFKVMGMKNKTFQNFIVESNTAKNAGYNLFTTMMENGFLPVGSISSVFVSSEDSVIILISNADDFESLFKVNTNVIKKIIILNNNFPNPFIQETNIKIEIGQFTPYSLKIYNSLGQKIKTLKSPILATQDYQQFVWKGENDLGETVANGLYFVQLITQNMTQNIKLVYIR